MTTASFGRTDHELIDLHEIVDVEQVVAELREASRGGGKAGRVWFAQFTGSEEVPALIVGVRNTTGALTWADSDEWVPAAGTNDGWVDYFTARGHHNPMPPHTELPIEDVLKAVAEFARTGERPTCIEWMRRSP